MSVYLPVIINAVLTLIVGILTRKLQNSIDRAEKEKKTQEAVFRTTWNSLQKGMQVLLRDQLLANYQSARLRGKITYDEADIFEAMYRAYHDLGGNGVMNGIYKSFRQFPVGTEDEVYPQEPRT